jgi:hypothetical protein
MITFEFGQVVAERECTFRIKSPLGPSVFALFAMWVIFVPLVSLGDPIVSEQPSLHVIGAWGAHLQRFVVA